MQKKGIIMFNGPYVLFFMALFVVTFATNGASMVDSLTFGSFFGSLFGATVMAGYAKLSYSYYPDY